MAGSRFDPRDLAEPIVLAPLAGGPTTPGLAAAVSNAGGLGLLGAGYPPPDGTAADIRATRALTDAPFGVNLFVPGPEVANADDIGRFSTLVEVAAAKLGATVGTARWADDAWDEKLALLEDTRPAVASFTFGCPSDAIIRRLQEQGTAAWVTVTDVDEALAAARAGADALVVQGVEAGGHRGSFTDRDGGGDIALLPLLRLVQRQVQLPLVAAGGIADGHSIAAVMVAGAAAAQLGTAFLRTVEAGTSAVHREALAEDRETVLTRAFTGRKARGLRNGFIDTYEADAISAYPEVHYMTAPMRAAARAQGDPESVNLWAGQAYSLGREIPAGELVRALGQECRDSIREVERRLKT
ncbi:MAG: nitronate monooxygenase [Candidatus Dormibacteria bacterium]